jgi:hypothetical protein
MELLLKRYKFTNISTIGKLYINGVYECFTLEDVDRGLASDQPLAEVQKKKVYGQTAIPYGRYQVIISFSNRFKEYMPQIVNVPGFEGIRIHAGNKAADTHGCPLTGSAVADNMVLNSRLAYRKLLAKLKDAEKKEKIFITIEK